ncbi:MAG: pilus assembly FimT family protein [bacterium]
MKTKAFTLIELMVVLAIIVIIATASVPQVQMWIARNRGNQAVSQLISDISKAKSISGYTVIDDKDDVFESTETNEEMKRYVGRKMQTGIVFRPESYSIVQRVDMSDTQWSDVNTPPNNVVRKKQKLPLKVRLEFVNGSSASDSSETPAIVLTSTGKIKYGNNQLVEKVGGDMVCNDVDSPINGKRAFLAFVRSMIDENKSIWYQVEIGNDGSYAVCQAVGDGGSDPAQFGTEDAGYVEL